MSCYEFSAHPANDYHMESFISYMSYFENLSWEIYFDDIDKIEGMFYVEDNPYIISTTEYNNILNWFKIHHLKVDIKENHP